MATVLGKKKGHQSFVSKFTMRKVFDEKIGHITIKTETHKLLNFFSFARHIRKYEQFEPKTGKKSPQGQFGILIIFDFELPDLVHWKSFLTHSGFIGAAQK